MMFRQKEKPREQKSIFSLTGNNYNNDKLNLLKRQLNNYMGILDTNMKEFKFCHIYASGGVDDTTSYPFTYPICPLSFAYKEGSLLFNDITKLVFWDLLHAIIKEMTQNLCLVISATNSDEFQSVIYKLSDIDRNQIPPIIVFASETCYRDILHLVNKIDLGIITIIQTFVHGDGFRPISLHYYSYPPPSCDQVNPCWEKLTIAIELLISQSREFLKEEVDQALVFQPTDVNNIIVDYAIPKRAF